MSLPTSKSTTNPVDYVDPLRIRPNENNPRIYFNDDSLDQLKTSIQEVGVLVPLIVYKAKTQDSDFVLLDGERRWRCALDLGLSAVPVNIIAEPTVATALIRMFNIHAVREEWPLISIALSLRKIIDMSGISGEVKLAELTGLTRATVRRAKKILSLPQHELSLIQAEAHLDRIDQVHREDLYIEILAAVSVILRNLNSIAGKYPNDYLIRQFARKREEGGLTAVTDFRAVGKLVALVDTLGMARVTNAIESLIDDVALNPTVLLQDLGGDTIDQLSVARRGNQFLASLERYLETKSLDPSLRGSLIELRNRIDQVLSNE